MIDSAVRAGSPPAVSSIRNVGTLLSLGWFAPASVQRSFEWDAPYATRLLNDIDKVLARLYPDADANSPDEGQASEEEEDAASDGAGVAAPLDDLGLDAAADGVAMARVAVDEEPPGHYFIGNLILTAARPQSYEVYDGLQRLTTLTILIAVLRDLIDDPATRAALHHLIFDEDRFRLTLFGRDSTFAEHVQAPGVTGLKSDSRAYYEIGRRILRVKNALRERIEQWDEARRVRYARFLLSSVWTSVLDVRDVRMARQMFVSTNLYGKPLETINVLKGQIADVISQSDSSEAVERFSRSWEEVKEISGDAFGEMLRAVDAIERTDPQDSTWPTELGGYLAKAYPARQIERFVRRLAACAHSWKDCKRILVRAGPSEMEQDFWRLHVFWWPEWHGLALRWWNQVHLARKNGQTGGRGWHTLESRFNRLHRRCMAITLAQWDEADRQMCFMRALRQDKAGRDVFSGALALNLNQRRRIDRTLRSQIHKEEIWAPLMRWIEIAEWREGLPELIRSPNTEHVRPRRPELADDRADDVRSYNEGCFSLGNLAVITKEGNQKALNRGFAQKLDTLREEARWSRTMRSVVSDSDGAIRTHWTNTEIDARTELLRQDVWKLLGLKPPG